MDFKTRQKIWKLFNGICIVCGYDVDQRICTIEHLIPKSAGGTDEQSNLAVSHYRCNQFRGTKSLISATNKIKRKFRTLSDSEIDIWINRSCGHNDHHDLLDVFNKCCVVCGLEIKNQFVIERITRTNVVCPRILNRGVAHNRCHQLRKTRSIFDVNRVVRRQQELSQKHPVRFQKWLNRKYESC